MRITKKIISDLEQSGVVVAGYDECNEECPKERIEQINFISWIRYNYPHFICFHPVNESDVPVQKRASLEQEGLLAGVPDIVILNPLDGYHFVVIEMKRKNHRKSEISKHQVSILKKASNAGGLAALAFGCDQGKKIIKELVL